MPDMIDRTFRELFPERANESLDAAGKVKAILENCNVQQIGEDAMLEALCEGMELQRNVGTHEWEIVRTKDHIEEILGVPIDWDDAQTILRLLQEGKEIPDIAARLRVAAQKEPQPA
ncbi:MAG: hypothetical protein V1696_00525 [Candidatus Jorgensenbacteria bacterium]